LAFATIIAAAQTSDVREAQSLLFEFGYDPGPVDGLIGPGTLGALERFQAVQDLPVTGQLDTATLNALREQAADSQPMQLAPVQSPITNRSAAVLQQPLPQTPVLEADNLTSQSLNQRSLETSAVQQQRVAPEAPSDAAGSSGVLLWLLLAAALFAWMRRGKGKKQSRPSTSTGGRIRGEKVVQRARTPPPIPQGFSAATAPVEFTVSYSVGGRRLRPSPVTQSGDALWVETGKTASVHGHAIGAMVYVGSGLQSQRFDAPDNCLIDPALPVARSTADRSGERMPYWPSYSQIDKHSRLAYLQWLAGGRDDLHIGIGFIFLYLYGLERRVLLDRCDAGQRAEIASEVERLLMLYGENRSFQRYAGQLLEAIRVLDGIPKLPKLDLDRRPYELPFAFRWAIGRKLATGAPLNAEWLLGWWLVHPDSNVRVPAKRAFAEFRRLFTMRLAEQHPDGMKLRAPNRRLSYAYEAASGSFKVDLTDVVGDVPDVVGLTAPLKKLSAIAERCMDDLDAYSRFLGRNPDGRGTLQAMAYLPRDLVDILPNRELDELKAWAKSVIEDAQGFVPVEDLLARLSGQVPQKISRKALEQASAALANLNLGFAPDPRFALRPPKIGEPIVLFEEAAATTETIATSDTYKGVLLSVTLGALMAHADGHVSEQERQNLVAQVDSAPSLSMAEVTRLKANLRWSLHLGPKLGDLRTRLKNAPSELTSDLAKMAVTVAAADGTIAPDEIKALQKIYKALGLNEAALYTDLHSQAAQTKQVARGAQEPVTVRARPAEKTGFAVPPKPTETAPQPNFGVNQDRVDAIRAETARASAVLHKIFGTDDESEDPVIDPVDATDNGVGDPLKLLDAEHRILAVKLASADSWTAERFNVMAKELGLMPNGALETLNEWAFEHWDEPYMDDDGDLIVSPVIGADLRALIGKGKHDEAA
jgi:tellurite resistance protein